MAALEASAGSAYFGSGTDLYVKLVTPAEDTATEAVFGEDQAKVRIAL